MGAAHYTADRRSGAMHGKVFLLDSIYAGIDQQNLYGRMDFADPLPDSELEIVVNMESWAENANRPRRALRLSAEVCGSKLTHWKVSDNGDPLQAQGTAAALGRNFEFKLPLSLLYALPRESAAGPSNTATARIRLRFSVWQNRLPLDALPMEGWMELQLLPEEELIALAR
jgi:hypothetical protein